MSKNRMSSSEAAIGVCLLVLFCSFPALAYVGPGPGLSMLGSLFALLGSVLAALFMVVLWPLRVYYKRWKTKRTPANISEKTTETP